MELSHLIIKWRSRYTTNPNQALLLSNSNIWFKTKSSSLQAVVQESQGSQELLNKDIHLCPTTSKTKGASKISKKGSPRLITESTGTTSWDHRQQRLRERRTNLWWEWMVIRIVSITKWDKWSEMSACNKMIVSIRSKSPCKILKPKMHSGMWPGWRCWAIWVIWIRRSISTEWWAQVWWLVNPVTWVKLKEYQIQSERVTDTSTVSALMGDVPSRSSSQKVNHSLEEGIKLNSKCTAQNRQPNSLPRHQFLRHLGLRIQ